EWYLVLPDTLDPLVVHVTVGLGAFGRVPEAAKLHVPGHAMVAEVLFRIEPAPRVDGTDLEARFAQRLDRHATAGSGSDHDRVIEFGHAHHHFGEGRCW